MNIYSNETYIIIDNIKSRFKKKYKNVNLYITPDIFNDLLKGLYITIVDYKLPDNKSFYIRANDYNNTGEFVEDIFNMISDKLFEIVHNYYTA